MKKISVLIPDSETGHTLVVARSLALIKEIEIHALSKNKHAAIKYSNRIKSFRQVKTDENGKIILEDLIEHIKRTKADILLPIGEPAHKYVSDNQKEILNYCKTSPVADPDIFDQSTDKWKLASFLVKHNIPCPKTVLIDTEATLENQLDGIGFPVIAKPTRGHGGLGIKKLDNLEEMKEFFNHIPVKNLGQYIVQEFVDGYDIDCSLLAKDGKILAHTIQKGFIPRANTFAASAGILFLKNDDLYNVVNAFVSNMKFSGIAHLDMRYDKNDGNFKIIEVNARFWGSLTGSQVVNVNFPYLTCLAALNQDFKTPEYQLGRYVDHTYAAKKMLREMFTMKKDKIKFRETDFKYILKDPVAEIVNIIQRRVSLMSDQNNFVHVP